MPAVPHSRAPSYQHLLAPGQARDRDCTEVVSLHRIAAVKDLQSLLAWAAGECVQVRGVRAGRGSRARGVGAGAAKGHLPDSGVPTSRPGPAGTLPSALSSPSSAGRSQPASVRARPRAGHPSPPPHSPGSGAALSGIRKQCILLKFRDRRRTQAGGKTRVRRRPKVHSGVSAAEQTEWACREAGAARARGSDAEGQADPHRVPPTRDLSLPCTLKGRKAARSRRAVPKTQTPARQPRPAEATPRAPTWMPHHSQRTPAGTSEEPQVFRQSSQRAPDGKVPSRQWWRCASYGERRQRLLRPRSPASPRPRALT